MKARKKTVLIADDDSDLIDQMKAALEKEYDVIAAYDGTEAVKMAAEAKPDCIVLDVMMNHMSDGLDAAKALKENKTTKNIPVIMLTSVNKHYDYRSQADVNFFPHDRWMDKPVNTQKLKEEIKQLLK
jgi:CheY-like chemotaxis protein